MGIHLLHVEHMALFVLFTVLSVVNSCERRSTSSDHWFLGYVLSILTAATSVALRGFIPEIPSIVFAIVFFVIAYLLLFISISKVLEQKGWFYTFQFAFLIFSFFIPLYFSFVGNHTKLRLLSLSIVLGIQQAATAIFTLRAKDPVKRKAAHPLAFVILGLAVANLIRIIGLLLMGAPSNYLDSGPFLQGFVIANTCLQSGAIIGYLWMKATLLQHDLAMQAATDPLTGLLNRRAIRTAAEREIGAALTREAPLTAISIDLDQFKRLNDTLGHLAGDTVLIEVAQCLQQGVRKGDIISRVGGDEFMVLLPKTDLENAEHVAQNLRRSIENLQIKVDATEVQITASFGLSQATTSLDTLDHLISRCDASLYAAKRDGGNAVILRPCES